MKTKPMICLFAGVVLLTVPPSVRAQGAATIMDQIGANPDFFDGANAYLSENLSDDAADGAAVIDDFSVPSATMVTQVSVAFLGLSNFTSYTDITGYDVNIYSSAMAAVNGGFIGDVYHMTISSAMVSITTPYSDDANSALVSLPVAIDLARGTYYVGVLADGSTADQVGVYATSGLSGSNPGGDNAYQIRLGGVFAYTNNMIPLHLDAAYRLTGIEVPEPGTWALLLSGLGVSAIGLHRHRHAA